MGYPEVGAVTRRREKKLISSDYLLRRSVLFLGSVLGDRAENNQQRFGQGRSTG